MTWPSGIWTGETQVAAVRWLMYKCLHGSASRERVVNGQGFRGGALDLVGLSLSFLFKLTAYGME